VRNPFAGGGGRPLTLAVLLCVAGAGLAYVAAGRVWERHPVDETGTDLVPGLSALALVALAGAGAVLATRGWARRAVGVLVLLVGLGLAVLALDRAFGAGTAWPGVTAAGGVLVVAGGLAAALAGHRWPAMGARYERSPRSVGGTTDAWNALDRGEDPTVR
jgi:Tryptophan-associated transmembrane protein (Trp_oprn_chp)